MTTWLVFQCSHKAWFNDWRSTPILLWSSIWLWLHSSSFVQPYKQHFFHVKNTSFLKTRPFADDMFHTFWFLVAFVTSTGVICVQSVSYRHVMSPMILWSIMTLIRVQSSLLVSWWGLAFIQSWNDFFTYLEIMQSSIAKKPTVFSRFSFTYLREKSTKLSTRSTLNMFHEKLQSINISDVS